MLASKEKDKLQQLKGFIIGLNWSIVKDTIS